VAFATTVHPVQLVDQILGRGVRPRGHHAHRGVGRATATRTTGAGKRRRWRLWGRRLGRNFFVFLHHGPEKSGQWRGRGCGRLISRVTAVFGQALDLHVTTAQSAVLGVEQVVATAVTVVRLVRRRQRGRQSRI